MEPKGEVSTVSEVMRPFSVSENASPRHTRTREGTRRPVGRDLAAPLPRVDQISADDRGAERGVYLDYNGSAPLDPRVAEVMVAALAEGAGNASSIHRFGRRQAAAVDEAREQVAAMVGGCPQNVVFTAGATEANNLALRGAAEGAPADCPRIVISAVEHASVNQTARWLDEQGLAKLDVVPVTDGGYVDLQALEAILDDDVLLVSVMSANSETGVLNQIAEVVERARAVGALFHCDATQSAGRLSFDLGEVGADLVSVSSHKICGPDRSRRSGRNSPWSAATSPDHPWRRARTGSAVGLAECRGHRRVRRGRPNCLWRTNGRVGTSRGTPRPTDGGSEVEALGRS